MEQPLLVNRIKPRRGDLIQEDKIVALVPELCYITGLTDDQRSNFTVMKDLGEHTRLSPAQRKIALERFINEINGKSCFRRLSHFHIIITKCDVHMFVMIVSFFLENPTAKKILTDWNLELDSKPVTLEGRIHSGPTLNFGKKEVAVQPDFGRDALSGVVNAVNKKFFLVLIFLNWLEM
jgi:PAZ domain